MSRVRITQQTTTSVPSAAAHRARNAPRHQAASWSSVNGLLQRVLEEPGWSVVRPCVDFALLCLAVLAALDGQQLTATRAPVLAMPAITVVLFLLRGLYRTRLRALVLDGALPILSTVSVAAMVVAMIGVFANGEVPAQSDWVRCWLLSLLFVGLGRAALATAQRVARKSHLIGKPVLIVGAGIVGSQVARLLEDHSEYGLVPVGFIDDDPRSTAEVGGRDVPVLGTVEDLDRIVERTHVAQLIIAFSSVADARISRLIQRSQELGVDIAVVPRMFDTINHRAGYETVGGIPLLSFSVVDPKGWQFAVKYALDRITAAVLLLLCSPLLAVIAVVVRLNSPGPIFFRQRRVGRDGSVFDLYKFRSMRMPSAQEHSAGVRAAAVGVGSSLVELEQVTTLARDIAPGGVEGADRRTAVGRILRRSSLDELPQLFNVLKGDMSIVGPRPERPEFVELFDQDVTRYGDRHRVKSGITGWAQVNGLRGQTSLAERIELDNYYIAHWSLGLDFKILLLTFTALFRYAE
ncbi:MAG TPA: exopolysaccharide biosynthesis polyprenyl glycosylphosphotransferase [Solirubrobacteraceae bacterium]|nr:exopolysaccharide biosynthesis polyprenyl glycosylphosphotransferase [Solirubrobacteraceae bacterium]